jgi:hypothetical protein
MLRFETFAVLLTKGFEAGERAAGVNMEAITKSGHCTKNRQPAGWLGNYYRSYL